MFMYMYVNYDLAGDGVLTRTTALHEKKGEIYATNGICWDKKSLTAMRP